MESLKFCTLLLIFYSARSQLEFDCRNADATSICQVDPTVAPTDWLSCVRGDLDNPPPVTDTRGPGEYTITWTQEPGEVYVAVAVNRFLLLPVISTIPPNSTNFILRGLTRGFTYATSVCYANVATEMLIRFGQFSVFCGSCATCLVAQPSNNSITSQLPLISAATRKRNVYTCEATGIPIPHIIWTAFNRNGRRFVPVMNGLAGIHITTTIDQQKITSRLEILQDSSFSKPICTARNENGEVAVGGLRTDFSQITPDEDLVSELTMAPDTMVTVPETVITVPETMVTVPDTTVTVPGTMALVSEDGTFPIYYGVAVAVVSLFLLALIVIVLITLCICVRQRNNRTRPKHRVSLWKKSRVIRRRIISKEEVRKRSLIKKLPKEFIISSNILQVTKIIGQGEFGVVYKGYLKSDVVAIKTLKGIFVTASDIAKISAEIMKMCKFDHPNVMRLIGVNMTSSGISGTGPFIVMPFMANGSLLDFIRKEADNLFVQDEDEISIFEVRKNLLQICLQIAQGMEYLASLKFIHRDLAARNCLMDINGTIKVSDFGLAEDIYLKNYYRQEQGAVKLPLKWMAPESIKLGVFSEKTDVWSYGVTCWEVFSGGVIPYSGIHPRDVINYLDEGQRLERPKNAACCDNMYDLLQAFWSHRAEARPDFARIVNILSSHLESTSDYLELCRSEAKTKVYPDSGIITIEEESDYCIAQCHSIAQAEVHDYIIQLEGDTQLEILHV